MSNHTSTMSAALAVHRKLVSLPTLIGHNAGDYFECDISKYVPVDLRPCVLRVYGARALRKELGSRTGVSGGYGYLEGRHIISITNPIREIDMSVPQMDMRELLDWGQSHFVHEFRHMADQIRDPAVFLDGKAYNMRKSEMLAHVSAAMSDLLTDAQLVDRWGVRNSKTFVGAVLKYIRINKSPVMARSVLKHMAVELEGEYGEFMAAWRAHHGRDVHERIRRWLGR